MKRFLLMLCVLLVAAPAALAQRSDVLLTHQGTLYSAAVERSSEHPEVGAASSTYIVVNIGEPNGEPRRVIVPATLLGGSNSNPALAYDHDSHSLFVFWQYMPNAMASELRFMSLDAEGNWSEPAAFQGANYHVRRNLRIAVTRKAYEKNEETGELSLVPEVNVHATWWEQNGAGENARYAMLTIRNSEVGVEMYDLSTFTQGMPAKERVEGSDFNFELFRHPSIFESPRGDSVELLFGDVTTHSFHRVTIKPIGNARVRIPVGIADKGFDGPSQFAVSTKGSSIETISPDRDTALFFFENDGKLSYLLYGEGAWSELHTFPEAVSRETAINALRRLIGAH